MKKVAFLSFDWDYKIVSEYYLGIQEHLRDRDDVQVMIFNAYGKYYVSHKPRESTFAIFSLYDPKDYDGLIIQGNRTWPPELRQEIVDRTVAEGKPVVSINYDLAGAHSVGTNNYQAEYDLVRKVLSERGCRRPAFVNGLATSVEAQDRARGFCDACAELGFHDPLFFQANWQMEAGILTAKKMLRRRSELPDVIFCCNDDLAVGVEQTLEEAGVRVPEDVLIAGFDNRVVGRRVVPNITTVDRDYRTIAGTALGMISRLMDGVELPDKVYSPAKLVLTQSCMYYAQSDAALLSAYRSSDSELDHYFEVLGNFQSVVLGAESLYSIMEGCEVFARELDCANAYVCLDDGFLNDGKLDEQRPYGSLCHLVARKGRVATMRCDGRHVYESYPMRDVVPPETPNGSPVYMVMPLYHNDACLGMVVTEGVPTAVGQGLTVFFLTVLSSAIAAARTAELLKELCG